MIFEIFIWCLVVACLISIAEDYKTMFPSTKKKLLARITELEATVDRDRADVQRDLTFLSERNLNLSAQLFATNERLTKHDMAAGGFWKTAHGEVLRVRDMSTGHINNCIAHLNEKDPKSGMLKSFRAELKRRKCDAEWRDRDAAAEKADLQQKIEDEITDVVREKRLVDRIVELSAKPIRLSTALNILREEGFIGS